MGNGLTRMICAGIFIIFQLSFFIFNSAQAQVGRDEYEKQRQKMREQYNQEMGKLRKEYDDTRRKAEEEYAAFRKKANEEYAAAMREAWEEMGVHPAEPKPKEVRPPMPRTKAPGKMPTTVKLPVSTVLPSPAKLPPAPLPPIPEPEQEMPTMQFSVYGTDCMAHADASGLRFTLPSVDEKSIAAAWQQLSMEKYDGLLHDCLARREEMRLSDWGYLRLLQGASDKLLGKGTNEAVLLQMYLLAQSGYRVRICRVNGHLALAIPFNNSIYNYSYVTIDDMPHYVLTGEDFEYVSTCKIAFPHERVANIMVQELPAFTGGAKKSRTLQAERFGTMKATMTVDQRLIDYLGDHPLTHNWEYYVLTGLSDEVKSTLYPALRSQIEGKSTEKAVLMLLDFVQSAFTYEYDDVQFGYDRPFFADESIYYPYNDCEDRSIFFSILVRDLLGLDVVLVHYPGHLATAVAFPNEVAGDYFELKGRRYTVCDPTYVGAGIGLTMDCYIGVDAKLVEL